MLRFRPEPVTKCLQTRSRKGGCHRPFDFHKVLKIVPECISEVGVFAAIRIVFYGNVMKWIQYCQEARLCFLASFDLIFTRICEM